MLGLGRIFLKLCGMLRWLNFLGLAAAILKSRRNLLLENVALRHQLLVLTNELNQQALLGEEPLAGERISNDRLAINHEGVLLGGRAGISAK